MDWDMSTMRNERLARRRAERAWANAVPSVMLWDTERDVAGLVYFESMNKLARRVAEQFPDAVIRPEAWAGGVPGMAARLPESDYDAALSWLTDLYGEPTELSRWHPLQRKGDRVMQFETGVEYNVGVNHINLFRMMQRKDKRYTGMAWT